MKPVIIFRHAAAEGPGSLADFLDERGIPWRLVRVDVGDALPESAAEGSGLVFMGGPMSVNDDLPWIPPVLALICEAVALDIPVLGHCLGGQLMSRALGGVVTRNPVKEIGWGEVSVAAGAVAQHWFGGLRGFEAFHWHGETFSLPPGGELILSSPYCMNQGFALGRHLGLQCHVEMTGAMIRDWCAVGGEEIAASQDQPAVQSPEQMFHEMPNCLPILNAAADLLYSRWIEGLRT